MTKRMIQLSSIGFLIVGLIFTSSSAFAYWNDVTKSRTVELVTVGEPITITLETIQSVDETVTLVPEGRVITSNQIDTAEFIYDIGVSEELLQTVNLNIYTNNVLINDSEDYQHLVIIDILEQGSSAVVDIENDLVRVIVSVKLLEPIDQEEAELKGLDLSLVNVEDSQQAYEAIVGQNISFELVFELEQKTDLDNN